MQVSLGNTSRGIGLPLPAATASQASSASVAEMAVFGDLLQAETELSLAEPVDAHIPQAQTDQSIEQTAVEDDSAEQSLAPWLQSMLFGQPLPDCRPVPSMAPVEAQLDVRLPAQISAETQSINLAEEPPEEAAAQAQLSEPVGAQPVGAIKSLGSHSSSRAAPTDRVVGPADSQSSGTITEVSRFSARELAPVAAEATGETNVQTEVRSNPAQETDGLPSSPLLSNEPSEGSPLPSQVGFGDLSLLDSTHGSLGRVWRQGLLPARELSAQRAGATVNTQSTGAGEDVFQIAPALHSSSEVARVMQSEELISAMSTAALPVAAIARPEIKTALAEDPVAFMPQESGPDSESASEMVTAHESPAVGSSAVLRVIPGLSRPLLLQDYGSQEVAASTAEITAEATDQTADLAAPVSPERFDQTEPPVRLVFSSDAVEQSVQRESPIQSGISPERINGASEHTEVTPGLGLTSPTPQVAAPASITVVAETAGSLNQQLQAALEAGISQFSFSKDRDGAVTVKMQLYPEELGEVRVNVRISEGAVSARFEASTSEAAQAIKDSLPSLRSALDGQGFTEVSLSAESFGSSLAQDSDRRSRRSPFREDRGQGIVPGSLSESLEAVHAQPNSRVSRLDYRF